MSAPAVPDARKLGMATAAAAAVAVVVLVIAVLPAEYGIDPTGIGHALGFSHLSEGAEPDAAPADANRTTYSLDAKWRVVESPVAFREGHTSAAEAQSVVKVPIAVANLTRVTATLRWDDADLIDGKRTLPDLFELSIDGPGGRESQLVQAENGPDGRGEIEVALAWKSLPAPERAADGLTLPAHASDASSAGEWTFTIRLYAARGIEGSSGKDAGNAWNLTIVAQSYALEVSESEGFVGDRVSLTLRPNSGLEYKFRMEPGATMRYQWEANAPLYFDLHAEEDGKPPEDFTRIQDGTSASESGSFRADVPGRYGWYFLNRGSAPVTVTLETTGEYVILGVV